MRTVEMKVELSLMDNEKPLIIAPNALQKDKMESIRTEIPALQWKDIIEAGLAYYQTKKER